MQVGSDWTAEYVEGALSYAASQEELYNSITTHFKNMWKNADAEVEDMEQEQEVSEESEEEVIEDVFYEAEF